MFYGIKILNTKSGDLIYIRKEKNDSYRVNNMSGEKMFVYKTIIIHPDRLFERIYHQSNKSFDLKYLKSFYTKGSYLEKIFLSRKKYRSEVKIKIGV